VFQDDREILFYACPGDVINQMNIMTDFKGHGVVKSFTAEFTCQSCGYGSAMDFDVPGESSVLLKEFSQIRCEKCATLMELDEEESSYLQLIPNSAS
jgi:hypothetical protein